MNSQPRIRLSALRAKNTKQEVKVFQDSLDNKPKFKLDQPVFVRNLEEEQNGFPEGLWEQ